jgi:hypothetical protein
MGFPFLVGRVTQRVYTKRITLRYGLKTENRGAQQKAIFLRVYPRSSG